MTDQEAHFIDLISDFGKAHQEFGLKGGHVRTGGEFSPSIPADESAHRKACDAYGALLDELARHFRGSRWRRFCHWLMG